MLNTQGLVASVGVVVGTSSLAFVLLREAYRLGARPIVYAVLIGEFGLIVAVVGLYALTSLRPPIAVILILSIVSLMVLTDPAKLVARTGGPVSVRDLRYAILDFEDVLHAQPPPSDEDIRKAVAHVRAATSLATRNYGRLFAEYVEMKQFGVSPIQGDARSLERRYLAAEERINRMWDAERSPDGERPPQG